MTDEFGVADNTKILDSQSSLSFLESFMFIVLLDFHKSPFQAGIIFYSLIKKEMTSW